MKRKLVILLVIVLCFMSIGCSNKKVSEDNKQQKETASKDEKVLNMALFWLDANLEPTEGWNGWILTRCGIGENLVQLDENLEFKSMIAESYESVDETTTVFNIRKGVKFHNGNPVDAQACKSSIERALKISDRDDVKFPVESITAEGQKLTIKTKKPYATLINNLADPVYIIVDTSVAEDENFKFSPVTTGAFKVTQFNPDLGMTLKKHEGYWGGNVDIDVVNVKYIQDSATRAMALQSGEIDFATQIGGKDLSLFENNDKFIVKKGPNLRIFLLRLNMDKPYMKKLEFRKALRYGIDKKTYASQIVNGISAKGPFNSMLSFGYKGEDAYEYNPTKAKELLDKCGFVDTNGDGIREMNGKNIVMKYISTTNHGSDANNVATAMQSQYKEIGLGLEILQVENYKDMAQKGDFDFLWERWTSAPTADPQYFMEAGYKTGSTGNYGHYSNPKLDAICQELDDTLDKKSRDELGIKASKILMEDVASLFMYYQEGTVVTRKNIDGIYRFISEIYYIDDRVKMK